MTVQVVVLRSAMIPRLHRGHIPIHRAGLGLYLGYGAEAIRTKVVVTGFNIMVMDFRFLIRGNAFIDMTERGVRNSTN
jgi:hypothetical protein